MKVLRAISFSILIAFFLTSGVTYAQNPAKGNYVKGVAYAIQGKFTKAKVEFEKARKVDPFYIPAEVGLETVKDLLAQKIKTGTAIHLFQGISYANQGQLDRAIREFNKALETNPKYALAYNNRGIVYVKKGQVDRAIRDFNKAIETSPKYALAYNNRGFAYHSKGQVDQAIRDYNKAIEINPKNADAYYNRGLVNHNKGQVDQAIRDYNKAIGINPRHAAVYNNRGLVYLVTLGNKAKGCADWKKACELGECRNYNFAKQKSDCP